MLAATHDERAPAGTPTASSRSPAARCRVIADALVLARKDLLLEVRRREVVLAMLQFVSRTLVIVHFALGGDRGRRSRRAAGGDAVGRRSCSPRCCR